MAQMNADPDAQDVALPLVKFDRGYYPMMICLCPWYFISPATKTFHICHRSDPKPILGGMYSSWNRL